MLVLAATLNSNTVPTAPGGLDPAGQRRRRHATAQTLPGPRSPRLTTPASTVRSPTPRRPRRPCSCSPTTAPNRCPPTRWRSTRCRGPVAPPRRSRWPSPGAPSCHTGRTSPTITPGWTLPAEVTLRRPDHRLGQRPHHRGRRRQPADRGGQARGQDRHPRHSTAAASSGRSSSHPTPRPGKRCGPVATFTSNCSGLVCDLERSASTDADGTIVSVCVDLR